MDNLILASHLSVLRQEISEIIALNRAYAPSNQHGKFNTNMREKRRKRLEEIKEELATLATRLSRAA